VRQADWAGPLREAYRQATSYPTSVPDRRVRALGRAGVAAIVERCCAMARRFAETEQDDVDRSLAAMARALP
jgi:hypothetical protein